LKIFKLHSLPANVVFLNLEDSIFKLAFVATLTLTLLALPFTIMFIYMLSSPPSMIKEFTESFVEAFDLRLS